MTSRFHALHHAGEPLLLPNAWDYASAAVLVAAGFPAIGTTSLGVAAAHGLPDAAGVTREVTVATTRRLSTLRCLLSVDIEGGFSADPGEVAELVTALAALGVAGINIEDGRPSGELADPAQHAELIAAVNEVAPSMFVNARVDTYWLGGRDASLAATVSRAHRYVTAGADGVFVPGVTDADHVRALVKDIPAPLNVLYVPGQLALGRLGELGVRRVSTGSYLFRTALHTITTAATSIRDSRAAAVGIPSYVHTQQLIADEPGQPTRAWPGRSHV